MNKHDQLLDTLGRITDDKETARTLIEQLQLKLGKIGCRVDLALDRRLGPVEEAELNEMRSG